MPDASPGESIGGAADGSLHVTRSSVSLIGDDKNIFYNFVLFLSQDQVKFVDNLHSRIGVYFYDNSCSYPSILWGYTYYRLEFWQLQLLRNYPVACSGVSKVIPSIRR
jgi:hypothetical protein